MDSAAFEFPAAELPPPFAQGHRPGSSNAPRGLGLQPFTRQPFHSLCVTTTAAAIHSAAIPFTSQPPQQPFTRQPFHHSTKHITTAARWSDLYAPMGNTAPRAPSERGARCAGVRRTRRRMLHSVSSGRPGEGRSRKLLGVSISALTRILTSLSLTAISSSAPVRATVCSEDVFGLQIQTVALPVLKIW